MKKKVQAPRRKKTEPAKAKRIKELEVRKKISGGASTGNKKLFTFVVQ